MNKKVMDALKNIGVPVSNIKRVNSPVSVSFFVVSGNPVQHDDDRYEYIEYLIQVDIWAKYSESIENLTKSIIIAMELNGFSLASIRPDLYEADTDIVHKPIEFRYLEEVR